MNSYPFGLSLSKPFHKYGDDPIRRDLVCAVLSWERVYGVAPQGVTGAIAEFDAAMLVGHLPLTYSLEIKPTNLEWDFFVWIRYDEQYVLLGAWSWDNSLYGQTLAHMIRLSPTDLRAGLRLA